MPPRSKPEWNVKLKIAKREKRGYQKTSVDGYWCKYIGGSDKNGNITIDRKDDGPEGITFQVSLKGRSNRKYSIKSGDLKSSSTDIAIASPSGNRLTITDSEATNNQEITYGVTVNPENQTSPDIVCDPAIIHRW